MKLLKLYSWLIPVVAVLSGCATGPKYAQVRDTIPALNPEHGRIFIYRPSAVGAAVQPDVKLNDVKVGTSKSKGFFYLDRPPGDYQISTSTEVKRTLSLTLDKAQTRYVRTKVTLGFFVGHVCPELVEAEQGEKEIQKCKFTGSKLPEPQAAPTASTTLEGSIPTQPHTM
ncbi:MAG TPA: DUF2846 domain-containing protein [Verrucomicrobiota bacterium]|mgnify:CR=1 FL=1|jgi:hypothetical protein|nr:DUF2846 domain-containing protein [Verrucomicrobiota bacterium]HQL79633.1 DUF2846 domain-containing protein [Verrucomicrobiota bacterium]